ncbi:MAG: STAS domain-containing protein [Chitinivibrionales bacterium]|nr:STAS domain-containing protein [Chitinivibrionales bacterium]
MSATEFEIKTSVINGVPVIKMTGMMKDQDVLRFSREMRSLVRSNSSGIIVDVSDLHFIDSHGLGILVYFHSMLVKNNRRLYVLNENRDELSYISGLFKSTHLDKVLKIVKSKVEIFQELS